MIINGREIAQEIQQELIEKVKKSKRFNLCKFSLHIFVVGENPVVEKFIKYKKIFANTISVEFIEHRFDDISEVDLITQIKQVTKMFQGTPGTFGMVVQLPLPGHIDTQRVLDSVPSELDVDGLATESDYLAPVAGAVKEILAHEDIVVEGKRALVIGKGKLVGEPVAKLLIEMGAVVAIADKKMSKSELLGLTRTSDIIVSGAGVPNLITKDMIKEGSALLDAGTSTQENSVVGDIALDCEEVARHFSRTPGGIGPITVAVLFKNLVFRNEASE
ncbi:MAG: bifunctional 5,10-methylenetetrahydrofolate dehydrogenase/5,10-methenyltetrahydrofolate cyclohydrolase [Candidatus Pacebacteria bacterium]|nr:bifunctional 5,10-methylenetetrahydrofolate dehydrogenase/5,10-methenyltetrahydrofolate cyclohydrolase [Candidatus Paceibacterota bacterium]